MFLNKDLKIVSILGDNRSLDFVTAKIISVLKGKDILLWQDKNLYFPCKRLQLCYGVDLLELLKWHIDDFEVLIISKLKDNFNNKETEDFIKKIKSMEEMQNKQVILLLRNENISNEVTLENFPNFRSVIKECSNKIYGLTRIENSNLFMLKDLINQTEELCEYCYDGLNESLRSVKYE